MRDTMAGAAYVRHTYIPDSVNKPMSSTQIWHLDGIDWFDAPRPRRWHRCWAQTYAYIDWFTLVERCPCGAIRHGKTRFNREKWGERNTRKILDALRAAY